MVGAIRNVNYDKGPKRWGELWWKKWDEKEVENRRLIKYSDYHTMNCETPTWSASNHELFWWEELSPRKVSKRERFYWHGAT